MLCRLIDRAPLRSGMFVFSLYLMVFHVIIAYTGGEAIANRPLHRFIFYIMAQWLNLHMSSADQSSVWNVGLHV